MTSVKALLVPLALLLTTLPVPEASADSKCETGRSGSPTRHYVCTFFCTGGELHVGAEGGDAGATVTAACGGASATCRAAAHQSCTSSTSTTLLGLSPGTCILEDEGGADDAAGLCSSIIEAAKCREELEGYPHAHTYGLGIAVGLDDKGIGVVAGSKNVTVRDTNLRDCNGDGVPGDFDGDYDSGVGGGFFGYGPWANEPTCNYGLISHSGRVNVRDVMWGSDVYFLVGADDTTGPVVMTDPVTFETRCMTSGTITPGDPAVDPTADADDCLTGPLHGSGFTCGAGGDGGYWVLLLAEYVSVGTSQVVVANTPTAGTISEI